MPGGTQPRSAKSELPFSVAPLAASGLVVIMIGATAVTLASLGVMQALIPLAVGIPRAFVAYRRWRQLSPTR